MLACYSRKNKAFWVVYQKEQGIWGGKIWVLVLILPHTSCVSLIKSLRHSKSFSSMTPIEMPSPLMWRPSMSLIFIEGVENLEVMPPNHHQHTHTATFIRTIHFYLFYLLDFSVRLVWRNSSMANRHWKLLKYVGLPCFLSHFFLLKKFQLFLLFPGHLHTWRSSL